MANYDTIVEAINADTTNMTVLRDHVKNDDNTSEYTTGIDWFKFNNAVVDKTIKPINKALPPFNFSSPQNSDFTFFKTFIFSFSF